MKIVSFNMNSIRARIHQLEALKAALDPDIIGVQETKVHDDEFPVEAIEALGYKVAYHGQKGHYGVATLYKSEAINVIKGFPDDGEDAQRRFITTQFALNDGRTLTVMNGYFPQGESQDHETKYPAKRKFYADLSALLANDYSNEDPVIVLGDINISPEDIDIGIGADNAKRWLRTGKCSFLPEEREWLATLKSWGLEDTYRKHHPDNAEVFSWFDYRSKGFNREPKRGLRIDAVMATPVLYDVCSDAGIDYEVRGMEKPSDHCPIWADFDIDFKA